MASYKSVDGEHVGKTEFGFRYMDLTAESGRTTWFLVSVLHAGCPPSTPTNSSAAHKCSISISQINHKSSLSIIQAAITFPLQIHFLLQIICYKMTTCRLNKTGQSSCFISLCRLEGFHISAALCDPLLPVSHFIPKRENLSSSKSFQNKSLHKQFCQDQTNMCLPTVLK